MENLPVAVVGGGPVGLATAAQLVERKQPFVLFEAGAAIGSAVQAWGHVRMFSPWRYNVDRAARRLLQGVGWQAPDDDALPNGDELVARYLAPLAAHPAIAPHIRLNALVASIGRKDFDKVRTRDRDRQPFEIRLQEGDVVDARAAIDASGTWSRPNPIGSGGVPVPGERACAHRISYGIPDVTGYERKRFAGKRVMVVGSGHSAVNLVLDLLALAEQMPSTDVTWVMRRENLSGVFGSGTADALPARGALGTRARLAVDAGRLRVITPYRIRALAEAAEALAVTGAVHERMHVHQVDEVIVATGFRPDLDMLREVRLGVDPWLESTQTLGPLIDPNEHSCGTIRPHGARELAHPEKDFYIVGAKSYGRAPTFLLAAGYEQARSVVAWLAGDMEAAARVELELPETGVCSAPAGTGAAPCCGVAHEAETGTSAGKSGCCGGPAPQGVDACCVKDADAKASGEAGCGCGSPNVRPARSEAVASACCSRSPIRPPHS